MLWNEQVSKCQWKKQLPRNTLDLYIYNMYIYEIINVQLQKK